MKRNLAWLLIVLTLTTLLLSPDPASAQEGAGNPCQLADEYLASGLIAFADSAYKEVLEASPTEECAIKGLAAIGVQKCEVAKKQAEAGETDAAKTTYLEVLANQPGLECALQGLSGLNDPVAPINRMIALGNYEQAWTKLVEALAKYPDNKELIAIMAQPWTWIYRFTNFWDVYAGGIISLLGSLVIFALFVYFWVRSNRLRLDVELFKMDLISSSPQAGDLTSLQERMVNRFEEAFNKLGQSRRVRRPDLIDQPMGTLAVPGISSLPTVSVTTKIIADILNIIGNMLPPKVVAVSCRLDEDGDKGLGIGIKLTYNRNKEVWGMDYIWEKDLAPGSLLYEPDVTDPKDHELVPKALVLVKYAAVLCIWRFIEGKYAGKAKTHLLNSFGTVDYRSHILTYLATELQTKKPDDLLPVEKLLRRALTLDPDNVAALNNIGFLMYQKGNIERKAGNLEEAKAMHAEGEKYLRRVFEISEQSDQFSTAFITAKYVLGIMYLDDGNLPGAASLLVDAENHARASGDTASDLLDMIRIPLASTLRAQKPAEAKGIIDEIAAKAQTNPRVVYNLACYFAAAAEDDLQNHFVESLRYLERTFITEPSYLKYSESDPSLQKLRDTRGEEYKKLLAKYADKPSETKPDEAKPNAGAGS